MEGDPLFSQGIDLTVALILAVKVLVVFGFLMIGVVMMVWFERKIVSDMQDRIGPARAGPWGILQTMADGIKLFFKEGFTPSASDSRVYRLAPYLSVMPAIAAFAIVPLGGTVTIAGRETYLQLADPPVGILFLLAMSSVAVYGVMLAGWSSGSKYPLLGSVRASAQMVSYEAALGLSVATAVLAAGTLSTRGIVDVQADWQWNLWTLGAVPFVIFVIAATAELNRPPFDLVEAEQELVGGFHTEYSAIRFAIFFLAEYANVITMSAIAVTLFLGGPAGPEIPFLPSIWPTVWFLLKLLAFLFLYVWLRATLPRLRYDQLMDLGWKKLIPLALFWFMLIAALRVADDEGWSLVVVLPSVIAVGGAGWFLLNAAVRTGQRALAAESSTDEAAEPGPPPAPEPDRSPAPEPDRSPAPELEVR